MGKCWKSIFEGRRVGDNHLATPSCCPYSSYYDDAGEARLGPDFAQLKQIKIAIIPG